MNKDNIYFKNRKSEFEKLLDKLENKSGDKTSKNPSPIPWKIIIPVGVVAVIAIIGIVRVLRRKRKQKRGKEEESL